MPSRWWIPVTTTKPESVTRSHLHAAVTRWFDCSEDEHRSQDKPFAFSPLVALSAGEWGFEVGVLTADAHRNLQRGAKRGIEHLGGKPARVGEPVLLHSHSWEQLAATPARKRWNLTFLTPTSFRTGGHCSPMPEVSKIVRSLETTWQFSEGVSAPRLSLEQRKNVWVSRLCAVTEDGNLGRVTLAGMVGELTLECGDRSVAQPLGALLALAPYSGIGAGRFKGMGVTRVCAGASSQRRVPSSVKQYASVV